VSLRTAPYPAFPTDMQAQFMAINCVAEGVAMIRETIFENRFMHAVELQRLGADIRIDGNTAVVQGVDSCRARPSWRPTCAPRPAWSSPAWWRRARPTIERIYHLDRGYERIEEKLTTLGALIKREKA
jgi:UDP-N-acetylglucosamine 1-carboxyvinyltransferase